MRRWAPLWRKVERDCGTEQGVVECKPGVFAGRVKDCADCVLKRGRVAQGLIEKVLDDGAERRKVEGSDTVDGILNACKLLNKNKMDIHPTIKVLCWGGYQTPLCELLKG